MKIKELHNLDFEQAINILIDEKDTITISDTLKDFAIKNINEDNLFLAVHILEALNDSPAYYFDYDYCMGTLEKPTPLETLKDLENYCEEGE